MRLFLAILFNETVSDALVRLQEDMKSIGVQGNFSIRENLHLTTAFIGEYGNPDDVMTALEEVDFESFPLRLDGVGHFGDSFWAGIAENKELEVLVKRIRRTLSQHGIPFDKKKFTPHITLIRKTWYKGGQKIPVYNTPTAQMQVEAISLMKSERGRHGMIYTEIGRIECED